MPIARVDLKDVEDFTKVVETEQKNAMELRSRCSSLDSVISGIVSEISRISSALDSFRYNFSRGEQKLKGLVHQLDVLKAELQAQEEKMTSLNSQLASLEAQLANTPPTITEITYIQDSEGNLIPYSEEIPNPSYAALISQINAQRSEIAALQCQIQKTEQEIFEITDRINTLESLLEELKQCVAQLESDIVVLNDAIEYIGAGQAQEISAATRSMSQSERAESLLKRIQRIIFDYLNESIELEDSN